MLCYPPTERNSSPHGHTVFPTNVPFGLISGDIFSLVTYMGITKKIQIFMTMIYPIFMTMIYPILYK